MISVVIPAHNEASVIERLLSALSPGIESGALDVVVVANGCTDDTATLSRAFPGVTVVEVERGHKPTALNEGERQVTTFPRFFVDADSQLGWRDLVTLAEVLESGGILAVSPALHVDASQSSLIVRSYSRIWRELPNVANALSSRGCFGVNEEGRRRWAEFPDVVNDDRYVHSQFKPDERQIVSAVVSTVAMPVSARSVIKRRSRVEAGLNQLSGMSERREDIGSKWAWLGVVRREPTLVKDTPAYVALTLLAKFYSARRRGQSTEEVWGQGRPDRVNHA
jgi:hypothetical protein